MLGCTADVAPAAENGSNPISLKPKPTVITRKDVQNGKFANDFVNEIKSGSKEFDRLRQEGSEHLIEETGKKLRDMMSWMQDSKLVDEKIK